MDIYILIIKEENIECEMTLIEVQVKGENDENEKGKRMEYVFSNVSTCFNISNQHLSK